MFTFYVIQSQRTGKLYKGHSAQLEVRLEQHNRGKTFSTRHGCPWKLVYTEIFSSREEAVAREKYYKTYDGGKALKQLLESKLAASE